MTTNVASRAAAAFAQRAAEESLRRELYFFNLYRLFEVAVLAFAAFGAVGTLVEVREPALLRLLVTGYAVGAVTLLAIGHRRDSRIPVIAAAGLGLDIVVAGGAMLLLDGLDTGISLLLVFNVGAAALLLSLRSALAFALVAGLAAALETLLYGSIEGPSRQLLQLATFAVLYAATAVLCHLLGRQMRDSAALANLRGEQIANLAELNELIIRRMRTGVLAVNEADEVMLVNEAAWLTLGQPSPRIKTLTEVSPPLAQRLLDWRFKRADNDAPLRLSVEGGEVLPRFAAVVGPQRYTLVFLDDAQLVSRRAEALTLANLGRLSASIAHEVRNPLAAISHAAQLLEESEDLSSGDRTLLDIVLKQCRRMNGIIENVLALSRRERSQPERLDLSDWTDRFVRDFRTTRAMEASIVRAVTPPRPLAAYFDQSQLHQVMTALVGNALAYGHLPGEAARVTVVARQGPDSGLPLVEVIDRGPGIPTRVAESIFEPFYTTHEHGTGLGLYIARQLCDANQALLEHVPIAGGGSCFRITLAPPTAHTTPPNP